jgi:hypothetical protein
MTVVAAFAGLERRLVAVPGLPLPADWLRTCCKMAPRSTAHRTCCRTWQLGSHSGLLKLVAGRRLVPQAKPPASRSEPARARASPTQAAQTLADVAWVEAADLPPTGYRLHTSRKTLRRVVLRIYYKIWPWSSSSCDSVRLLRRRSPASLAPAGQTGRSRSAKVPDQIRERPRPPTKPPTESSFRRPTATM